VQVSKSFSLVTVCLQDMIHIADTKVARRYGDFFIRNIHKFEEASDFCLRLVKNNNLVT
jgi:RNA polymerase I-associated factor PAF67